MQHDSVDAPATDGMVGTSAPLMNSRGHRSSRVGVSLLVSQMRFDSDKGSRLK